MPLILIFPGPGLANLGRQRFNRLRIFFQLLRLFGLPFLLSFFLRRCIKLFTCCGLLLLARQADIADGINEYHKSK